jgi:iron complex transport system ATP-binding protein
MGDALALEAHSVSVAVGEKTLVAEVSFAAKPGEVVGLVGANGSGKSTLLRCLAGLRRPSAGHVSLGGAPLAEVSPRERARRIALVEQSADTDTELRVREVVALGRIPHRSRWDSSTSEDGDVVLRSLDAVGLLPFASRRWASLSGGERQRAHIARAFAQQPGVLLLDEPTNHLDVRHQFELMDLLAATPQTVVVVLHDLALAAAYCDRVVLLEGGRLTAFGTPREVLTVDRIATAFGVNAELEPSSRNNAAGLALRLTGVAASSARP